MHSEPAEDRAFEKEVGDTQISALLANPHEKQMQQLQFPRNIKHLLNKIAFTEYLSMAA